MQRMQPTKPRRVRARIDPIKRYSGILSRIAPILFISPEA
jgi:hypothetical protein